MKFSVWPMYSRPWDELISFARHAEAGGWHCLWYADHYMGNTGTAEISDEGGLECWAAIAALAGATSTIRLGTLVAPTTVHHPAILANRAASIDRISNGRLILGIGAGWQINEHAAYGIELFEPGDRVTRFDEAIQILRSMLSQPRTTFAGKHFTITDAPCEPKPVQQPLPILVGTSGPRMSRIAARHADEWNVWGTPERVAEAVTVIDEACDAVGRDRTTLRRSTQAMVFMTDDADKAAKIRLNAPADRTLIGSTAFLVDQMGRYAELGIDEFILPDFTLGRTPEQRFDAYDRFAAEVVAQLR
jgi:probable F420-dependent oxidoreductase